ncbi:MAG: hypothetical protein AAGA11_00450 [Pseudomonadota bacterium]
MTALSRARRALGRTLAVTALAAPVLVSCMDGGMVGTGSGPSSEVLIARSLPTAVAPDIPRAALQQLENDDSSADGLNNRSISWTSTELFNDIYHAEQDLLELFALFNAVIDTLDRHCPAGPTTAPCTIPAGQLRSTYTQDLIDDLIAERLSSAMVTQMSAAELTRQVANLNAEYDAKRGQVVRFGETTISHPAAETHRISTSVASMFGGNPVKIKWSELEGWVEVRYISVKKSGTTQVNFRFENHADHTWLTRTEVSSNPNTDLESSITVFSRREETSTLLWSGHLLGVQDEYGIGYLSMKGRADMLGAYTLSRLHSPHGTDATRLIDREVTRNDDGRVLAKRYCTGQMNSPLCLDLTYPSAGRQRVQDSDHYINFDTQSTDFLPDLHVTKWQVFGLPRDTWRFAVYEAGVADPSESNPLCRGYRIGQTKAFLHCASAESLLHGDALQFFDVVVNGQGQQFIRIPGAWLEPR